MTMSEDDDILGELFHGCALAAFVDQAIAEGGPPDSEATRRRAYRYYEEALAEKNAAKQSGPAQAQKEPEHCWSQAERATQDRG